MRNSNYEDDSGAKLSGGISAQTSTLRTGRYIRAQRLARLLRVFMSQEP